VGLANYAAWRERDSLNVIRRPVRAPLPGTSGHNIVGAAWSSQERGPGGSYLRYSTTPASRLIRES
jgi:hypothetical protein